MESGGERRGEKKEGEKNREEKKREGTERRGEKIIIVVMVVVTYSITHMQSVFTRDVDANGLIA